MRLYCEGKVYDLSIQEWDPVYHEWRPDIFHDLETNITDGSDVSLSFLESLENFWVSECRAMTNGSIGELADYGPYHDLYHFEVIFSCEEVIL